MRLDRAAFSSLAVAAFVSFALACAGDAPTGPESSRTESAHTVTAASPGTGSFRMHQGKATRDLGRLSRAGWLCVSIPSLGVHCFAPGAFASTPSVQVLVFDTEDPEDPGAPFLGTEVLIRADLYAGQPCPAEGGGEYEFLPMEETGLPADYRACHHYAH